MEVVANETGFILRSRGGGSDGGRVTALVKVCARKQRSCVKTLTSLCCVQFTGSLSNLSTLSSEIKVKRARQLPSRDMQSIMSCNDHTTGMFTEEQERNIMDLSSFAPPHPPLPRLLQSLLPPASPPLQQPPQPTWNPSPPLPTQQRLCWARPTVEACDRRRR